MRTIKFRAWDKAINKMITQENVKEFLGKTISEKWEDELPYSNDEWYPAYEILTIFDYLKDFQERTIKRYEPSENRFELMQYTGLHDKNNKEIYEGDVLQIDVDKAWVRWNNKYGYFQLVPIGDYYFDSPVIGHILEYSEAEVIGNIYENKELLNETNR